MKASRKNPWVRTKKADGEICFKYDFKDSTWGIPRTRKTFKSAAECKAYHEALISTAKNQAGGGKPKRCFAQALTRYLEEKKHKTLSYGDLVSNCLTLRWPYRADGQWHLLEDKALDDGENGIVAGYKNYLNDISLVVKRSYVNHEIYHLRREDGGLFWYEQPSPKESNRPQVRRLVTNQSLIAKLNASQGRGPFSPTTLHTRERIVKTILKRAKKNWRWVDTDLGEFISENKPEDGVINFITKKELDHLINETDEFFGYLILGGCYIGWRQANLIGLTWDRVIWSQKINNDGNIIHIPGYVKVPKRKSLVEIDVNDKRGRRVRTKNGEELETIMTDRTEALLKLMWEKKHPESEVVFHRGDGEYWGNFSRRWRSAKKRAGIDPAFRWHDLRHTWATEMINSGVDKSIIQVEQGWKDAKMVDRYAHIQHQARYAALKKAELEEHF